MHDGVTDGERLRRSPHRKVRDNVKSLVGDLVRSPSKALAFGLRSLESGHDTPWPNPVALEFGQGGEHGKLQLARRRAEVDPLVERCERDAALVEFLHERNQVRK
jgi:hypothetical protein